MADEDGTDAPLEEGEQSGRARRRDELLQQLAELRGLRARLRPTRARLDRDRAALRRTLGRL